MIVIDLLNPEEETIVQKDVEREEEQESVKQEYYRKHQTRLQVIRIDGTIESI